MPTKDEDGVMAALIVRVSKKMRQKASQIGRKVDVEMQVLVMTLQNLKTIRY